MTKVEHLRAEGVSVHFAGVKAVDGVDLTLDRGEILGLIGPNGAGKTTLVNALSGFQEPTAGTVRLDDADVTGWLPHRLARTGVARTFQSVRLFPRLSVLENVTVGALALGISRGKAEAHARELLAQMQLTALIHAPEDAKLRPDHVVEVATGGAAPPSTVIAAMESMGFRVTHLYGLTESYGPATICAWQAEWDVLPLPERAAHAARQGVAYPTLDGLMVADPVTLAPVPRDGATMGEVMLRGNTLMKGYLRNPAATEDAFRGGWFHTGDLAVWHADGYIEIKDRSKDVIISGGENVSSLEVEEVLYRHPGVMEAAVVAKPDPKWGEAPCAFVTLKPEAAPITSGDLIAWCREHLAHFKVPRAVAFGPLPKTSTGKIQKYVLREQAKAVE